MIELLQIIDLHQKTNREVLIQSQSQICSFPKIRREIECQRDISNIYILRIHNIFINVDLNFLCFNQIKIILDEPMVLNENISPTIFYQVYEDNKLDWKFGDMKSQISKEGLMGFKTEKLNILLKFRKETVSTQLINHITSYFNLRFIFIHIYMLSK